MTTNDDDLERLAALALGEELALGESDEGAWLREGPERSETLADFRDVLGALTLMLPRPPCPEGGRETLLAATEPTSRWRGLERRLSRYFDLSRADVDALIGSAFDPERWVDARFYPGLMLFHLEPGPRLAGADAGLVRIPAGSSFPRHKHLGDEYAFILQGEILDDRGKTYGRGDVLFMPEESEHSFDVLPSEDLVYALILYKGVDFRPGGIDLIVPANH